MSKRDFVAPGIYILLFIPDGSIYVGATNNLHARLREHLSAMESGRHSNQSIRRLVLRFGPESLEIFIPHRAPHFDRPWDLSAWLYGAELTAYERLLASGAPVLNLERPKRISPKSSIKRAAPREHFTQMTLPSPEVQSVGLCAIVHRPTNRVLLGASINRTGWHYQQRNHFNAGRHSNPVWRNLIWTHGKSGFEGALLAEAPRGMGGMDLLFWQRGALEITSELLTENGMDVVVPKFRGGRVRSGYWQIGDDAPVGRYIESVKMADLSRSPRKKHCSAPPRHMVCSEGYRTFLEAVLDPRQKHLRKNSLFRRMFSA